MIAYRINHLLWNLNRTFECRTRLKIKRKIYLPLQPLSRSELKQNIFNTPSYMLVYKYVYNESALFVIIYSVGKRTPVFCLSLYFLL